MYICICRGVTDTQIRQAVHDGAQSITAVRLQTGATSQCGKCGIATRDIIKQELAELAQPCAPELFYRAS